MCALQLSNMNVVQALGIASHKLLARCTGLDVSCVTAFKAEGRSYILLCIRALALLIVLVLSWARTIKHDRPSDIAFCIPQVARRAALDVSYVATLKHECRSDIAFCIP